jgi:hypothetical protein
MSCLGHPRMPDRNPSYDSFATVPATRSLTRIDLLRFRRNPQVASPFPRKIDHPVFGPSLACIHGAMALPVRRTFRDLRPCEPRKNSLSTRILPLAVKIDSVAFKSSTPDLEAGWRRSVRPRMFPLAGLRIEGTEAKALDDRSLIGSLEEFQENAAIQDLVCPQGTGALAPGSIGPMKIADGVPLAFEKIKLLCLRVRCLKNHIAHTGLPK